MNPDRRKIKEKLLADRRRWGSAAQQCEGRAYMPHVCQGALRLNEVIFTRDVIKHLTPAKKRYFWHAVNCSINCDKFHVEHGHSHKFRRWFLERVSQVYGGAEVANWIGNAPLKMKEGKGGVGR